VPIFAAAPGTVLEVNDGDWDRNTPEFSQPGANYVIIDHGNGWKGYYWHARLNSVAVSVGQTVTRGQTIAMVGSSGFSSDSHLHVSFYYRDALVETYTAPNAYWNTPYTYSGDLRTSLDADMTDSSVAISISELRERPAVQRNFVQGETATTWAHVAGLAPGENIRFRYIGPNDVTYADSSFDTSSVVSYGWYAMSASIPTNAPLGAWRAVVDVAGVNKWQIPFTVSTTGTPNLQLSETDTPIIIDGRRTPIDFGTALQSSGSSESRTFTLRNRGSAPLSVTDLQLPQGFLLDGSLPTTIAPNSTDTFTVTLDRRFGFATNGNIILTTNDPDQPTTMFAVKGTMVDDRPPSFVNAAFDVDANQLVVDFDEFIDFGYFYDPGVTLKRLSDNATFSVEPAFPGVDRSKQRFNFPSSPAGLPDGNYRLTLPANTIGDLSSQFATTSATIDFYVLSGDANRDRMVNFADLVILARNFNQSGKTYSLGNFNYSADGKVDFADLVILARNFNKSLPLPVLGVGSGAVLGAGSKGNKDLLA
jgi:murein DD-endopeptidase MepM/ murein hydrolase activator NlpD